MVSVPSLPTSSVGLALCTLIPTLDTETCAVLLAPPSALGRLASMVTGPPAARPLTGIVALRLPAGIVMLAGTEAIWLFDELSVTVVLLASAALSESVKEPCPPTSTVELAGDRLMLIGATSSETETFCGEPCTLGVVLDTLRVAL